MRILITNDDGVEAPGIRALAIAVHDAGHEVIVVAPIGDRSGAGAATGTIHRAGPIPWWEVQWPELSEVAIYSVDLPPAGAVYTGLVGTFGPAPDLVISGINRGLNYGHLALHSGTVGAALTACALGIPAIAVSIAWSEHPHWPTAGAVAVAAIGWAAALDPPAVVNLSVPDVPYAQLRGVGAATPAHYAERWSSTTKPGELLLHYDGRAEDPAPGSDLALVRDGIAAVTVLTGIASAPSDAATAAITAVLEKNEPS